MNDRREMPDLTGLEERVGELERLADSLGGVPDEELVEALKEAVRLLGEINARLEAGLGDAAEESREIETFLERLDFRPLDEALEDLERQEGAAGELGVP